MRREKVKIKFDVFADLLPALGRGWKKGGGGVVNMSKLAKRVKARGSLLSSQISSIFKFSPGLRGNNPFQILVKNYFGFEKN